MKILLTAAFLALASPVNAEEPSVVNRIYTYECAHTIFEGEGAAPGNIECLPGQHLGVFTLKTTHVKIVSSNYSSQPSGDSAFPGPVCSRNSFLRTQCAGNAPKLAFGLSSVQSEKFSVPIVMSTGPDERSQLAGYAAAVQDGGTCPNGLKKARIFRASLKRLASPLPTTFENREGNYDSVKIAELAEAPGSVSVLRQRSQEACDQITGSCENATFAGAQAAHSVEYKPEGPVICVHSKASILGAEEKAREPSAGVVDAI